MPELLQSFETAVAHRLFDAQWYMKQYNLHFETEIDAYADYLRKSRHSWLNPSPLFSTKSYFKSHWPELINTEVAPLDHLFDSYTEKEYHSYPNSLVWEPFSTLRPESISRFSATYAITAHIFYDDYILKFADCLSDFKFNFDVFITVTSERVKDVALNAVGNIDRVNTLVVRVVPNRGRNFGPLLVEFGRVLLNYDFFCHVHSKKSLFSGSNQEIWGNYLFEYLLQDKQLVHQALSLLEQNTTTGLYFPTAFTRSLPKWACHTLKNKQAIKSVAADLGIEPSPSGFLSYPVGGMFWARSDALRPLLARDWQYSDFPEEPIPHDGTSLHAIERLLVNIAESRGYQHFVYHPASGKFTQDKGHLLEEYIGNKDDLGFISTSSPHKCVSFDIFDTLVFRQNQYPDQAKINLASKLGFDNANEFLVLRNSMELEIRKEMNFTGDVSLSQVYERLRNKMPTDLSAEQLADMEFEEDLITLLPKSEIVKTLKTAISNGRQIMIATDTYYERRHIEKIISMLAIPESVELFISSELQLRKDNGTMWQYIKKVLQERKINPLDQYIHIGDNVVSDAQIAGDHGLGNYHILNPFEKWNHRYDKELHESDLEIDSIRGKYGPLIAHIGARPFI